MGVPEASAGRDDSDDRVEKTSCLMKYVGQPLVVSAGEVTLKRRRLDLVDGENGEQRRMTAEWFLVLTHHAPSSLLDLFCGFRDRSF